MLIQNFVLGIRLILRWVFQLYMSVALLLTAAVEAQNNPKLLHIHILFNAAGIALAIFLKKLMYGIITFPSIPKSLWFLLQ